MHLINLKLTGLFGLLLLAVAGYSQSTAKQPPVPVIFDTDMGPDYDDVGAITLLNAYASQGKASMLATIASSKYDRVAQVLSVLNTYFGQPDIPIGVPKGEAVADGDWQHWSDTLVARYPHAVQSNAAVPDAVEVYRKVLAAQPDRSVTVITVGFLTNLAKLLDSTPDQYSKLSGKQLVAKKVKQLVSMAGAFPSGSEFNVYKDGVASKKTFDQWPTPIVFSGFEIGEKIKTGIPLIQNENIRNSPVKDVYAISIPQSPEDKNGRMSWDQTAVLVAVEGTKPYYDLKTGKITINKDGSNGWDATQKGHTYLVKKVPVEEVTQRINQLMMFQPKQKTG